MKTMKLSTCKTKDAHFTALLPMVFVEIFNCHEHKSLMVGISFWHFTWYLDIKRG